MLRLNGLSCKNIMSDSRKHILIFRLHNGLYISQTLIYKENGLFKQYTDGYIYKNIRIFLMGLLYPTAVLFKCEDYRTKIKYQVVESVQKNSGLPTYPSTFKLTGAEIR